MKRIHVTVLLMAVCLVIAVPQVEAQDAARDLRRMIGYTIIDAASIKSVSDGDSGGKVVVFDNGMVFQVQMLLLPPLPMTDVIIFGAKAKGTDIVLIKLLIDNEAYDAVALE